MSVLADLQFVVQKYVSLDTDEKSAWDRFRLGNEDIDEIRGRLVYNMTLLTSFRRFVSLRASTPFTKALNTSIIVSSPNTERSSIASEQGYVPPRWVVELGGPEGYTREHGLLSPSISENAFFRSETDAATLVGGGPATSSPTSRGRP